MVGRMSSGRQSSASRVVRSERSVSEKSAAKCLEQMMGKSLTDRIVEHQPVGVVPPVVVGTPPRH
jgi:hypothetical protein